MATTKEKYSFVRIRAVDNGWEVFPSLNFSPGTDHFTSECYVFEKWNTLMEWLADNIENNARI